MTGARSQRTGATRLKFCGLHRPEDVAAANRTRPDFAGFVVDYPPSRRSVSIDELHNLRAHLHPSIAAVGVFVDRDPAFVANVAHACRLDYVQLHGDEDERCIARLRELNAPPLIKAFVVQSPDDVMRARASSADCVLLDGGKGSGRTFDWTLAEALGRPFFLSGGLDANTAGAAIVRMHPFALDVSSGIETDGRKDEAKMEALIRAVRLADAPACSTAQYAPGDGFAPRPIKKEDAE